MADLASVSVLLIDANAGMRAQLRNMLSGFGIERIEQVSSAAAALRRLREARFDIVLCEFNLGEGQDGQHLLEDLRSNEIIPLTTLFIMVTAERNYERVVSTAELAPNDYVLKPLASHVLRYRLERALDKRDVFMPAYRHIEMGDPIGAVELLQQAERDHPRYATDLLRLQAELHLSIGELDRAEAAYRQALQRKALPWAELGLARIAVLRKHYTDAEERLTGLIAEHDDYIDAYDLLARCREQAGRPAEACDALLAATKRSPHRLARLRHLGEIALETGDFGRAEEALAEVVRKGKVSNFADPEDHVRLLQAQLGQGQTESARATLSDLARSMAGQPKAPICVALARALYHSATGAPDKARAALHEAVATGADSSQLSIGMKQELVRACFDNELDAEGSELVLDILRNTADEHTLNATRAALRARGRELLAEQLEERTREEVRNLVARGAAKAKAGDFDGAVSEMMHAVRQMPGNPHVLFNAALALLRHVEHRGWNERFARQAGTLIARARRYDPLSPRLAAISAFMHSLFQKYAVQPNDNAEGSRKTA